MLKCRGRVRKEEGKDTLPQRITHTSGTIYKKKRK
jgi:hypothetical protein